MAFLTYSGANAGSPTVIEMPTPAAVVQAGGSTLANYEAGLREIQRVLKPDGTLAILEFTEPPDGLLGDLYRWYFCTVLPKIGGLISGDQAAYKYLPKSVARFFRPAELAAFMTALGFQSVDYSVWTLGTVVLHTAIRV